MGLSDNLHRLKKRNALLSGGYSITDYVPPRKGPYGLELHVPLANYEGPRTDIKRRLAERIRPTTHTDAAARQHDIAYYNIGAKVKRGAVDRKKAYQLIKQADNRLMKSALVNKVSLNPIEHIHANAALAGMAGKKLLQSTGAMDELKYVGEDHTDELDGGKKKKRDKLSGLKRRFKKLKLKK